MNKRLQRNLFVTYILLAMFEQCHTGGICGRCSNCFGQGEQPSPPTDAPIPLLQCSQAERKEKEEQEQKERERKEREEADRKRQEEEEAKREIWVEKEEEAERERRGEEEAERKRREEEEESARQAAAAAAKSRSRAMNALERLGGFWKSGRETLHINTRTMEVEFPGVTMNIKVLSDRLHLYYGVYGENHVWELELDSDEDNMFCRHLKDETKNCPWNRVTPSSSLGSEQMEAIDKAVKNHLRRGQFGESKFESVEKFVKELDTFMEKHPKTSRLEIAERIQKVYPESFFTKKNERKQKLLEILKDIDDSDEGPKQKYPFANELLFVMEFHDWLMEKDCKFLIKKADKKTSGL